MRSMQPSTYDDKLDHIISAGAIGALLWQHLGFRNGRKKRLARFHEDIHREKEAYLREKGSFQYDGSEGFLDSMTVDCIFLVPAVLGVGKWLGLGHPLGRAWRALVTKFSPKELFRLYFVFTVIFYFGLGSVFSVLDLLHAARKVKYQPNSYIEHARLPKVIALLCINVAGPLIYGLTAKAVGFVNTAAGDAMWAVIERIEETDAIKRMYSVSKKVPSLASIWRNSMIFLAIYEVGGYLTHRAFHHPFLYKTIHRVHHENVAPFALTAAYAHPVEYAVSNVGPALATSLLLKPHMLTLTTYSMLGIFITQKIHCGYGLFGDEWTGHDIHHEKKRSNYGFLSIMDKICGTHRHARWAKEGGNLHVA